MTVSIRLALPAAVAVALAGAATGANAQETIRLGTEGAYPPFNYTNAAGELEGFEIDMGNALCERMGVECEWVAQDWDGIIPALLQGRYDAIIAAMNITEERQETIDFTQDYVSMPVIFVGPADDPEFQAVTTVDELAAALEDEVVGVQEATIFQTFVETALPDVELRTYGTQEQLNLDLVSGRVDAGLADSFAWKDFLESEEGADYAQFGPGLTGEDFPVLGRGMGIGLRPGDDELRARFDEALCELAEDGTLSELSMEWFEEDISLPCRREG